MRTWLRVATAVTMLLLAACGGNEGEPPADASDASSPAGVASPSEAPTEESPFPDGSYRSPTYTEDDIRAIVPDKLEDAVLENELEGGDAITWTFEFADGAFAWNYEVEGVDAGVGLSGTYSATENTISLADEEGACCIEAGWELAGDELRLTLDHFFPDQVVNGVPAKWYGTYIMSEAFTKEA